jgi:hypothetical protein
VKARVPNLRQPLAAIALALAASFAVLPAHAEKPASPLPRPTPIAMAAAPIDFDRDNPSRKEFGKLIFRAGLNLYARSAYFGGFSALAIDASGRTLLALSDAGSWLRATLDYDGRKLKGLDDGVLGPRARLTSPSSKGTGSRAIRSTPSGSDRLRAPSLSRAAPRVLAAIAGSRRLRSSELDD